MRSRALVWRLPFGIPNGMTKRVDQWARRPRVLSGPGNRLTGTMKRKPKQGVWLSPTAFVFLMALFASLGVHLPVYEVLGQLAKMFEADEAKKARAPQRVEFEVMPS